MNQINMDIKLYQRFLIYAKFDSRNKHFERYKFVNDEYNQFHFFLLHLLNRYDSYKNLALFSRLNNQGLLQDIENRQNRLKILDPEIINGEKN